MSDIQRERSGVYTSEGQVGGARAARLAIARQKEVEKYNGERKKIKEKHARVDVSTMDSKFQAKRTKEEETFKAQTVGMVTLDEYIKAKNGMNTAQLGSEDAGKLNDEERRKKKMMKKKKKKKRKEKRKAAAMLSFDMEGERDDEEGEKVKSSSNIRRDDVNTSTKKRIRASSSFRFGKDPAVTTNFLPDVHREKEHATMRRKYVEEWTEMQKRIKKEKLQITYSYWDGSGHRRSITLEKGTTIGKFVELVRVSLINQFKELRSTSSADLLYVKEDLIIPHHYTFYDLIATKARGKSGPLFHFDVHDDVRLVNDSRVEKDESHPGKIVERRWFERNKHIFPASRWEMYDPSVTRDKYSIHGGEIRGTNASKKSHDGATDAGAETGSALAGIWSVGANL
eukprot:g4800.t1